MARNNPAWKILEFFLAGTSLVSPKCTNFRQNVQIPQQNEPKCANSFPWQEKWQRNSLLGVRLARNFFIYQPEEFLRDPPCPELSRQTVS